jgi:hypothetical protein
MPTPHMACDRQPCAHTRTSLHIGGETDPHYPATYHRLHDDRCISIMPPIAPAVGITASRALCSTVALCRCACSCHVSLSIVMYTRRCVFTCIRAVNGTVEALVLGASPLIPPLSQLISRRAADPPDSTRILHQRPAPPSRDLERQLPTFLRAA